MNIREYSVNLLKIYDELGTTFSDYQKGAGLHCLPGCGRCCNNPDIEASMWEMIPLAFKFYQEGKLEEWIEKLEKTPQDTCLLFVPESQDRTKGKCGAYTERPLVCRLFGVAGHYNKHHNVTLSICKYIKQEYPDLAKIVEGEATEENTPMLSQGSFKLTQLDPQLIQNRMPVNQALKLALEKVALYAQYHPEI